MPTPPLVVPLQAPRDYDYMPPPPQPQGAAEEEAYTPPLVVPLQAPRDYMPPPPQPQARRRLLRLFERGEAGVRVCLRLRV